MNEVEAANIAARIAHDIDEQTARFAGRRYAFMTIQHDDGSFGIAVAVAYEDGCYPLTGPSFDAQDDAIELSICLNIGIGLSLDDVWNIVCANNFHQQGGRHGHGIIHRAHNYRGAPRADMGKKSGSRRRVFPDQASTLYLRRWAVVVAHGAPLLPWRFACEAFAQEPIHCKLGFSF